MSVTRCWSLLLVFLLAACVSSSATPPPGDGGFVPPPRDATLPPPLAWQEATEEVTRANAARLSLIGRLDSGGAPSTVFAAAFSPDSSRLAALNNDQLLLWNLISGALVFNTARADAVSVYYSAAKDEIYTLDSGGQIRIYDTDLGREKTSLPGQSAFNGVTAYDANNGWLALAGVDGTVKVWDVAARQSLVTINAHQNAISALAFSADGEQLATGDGINVRVWDWRTRQPVSSFEAPALRLAFSPDGAEVAVGEPQKITLWQVADGQLLHTLNTGVGGVRDVLRYAPDGQFVLNGGAVPTLNLWDATSGLFVNALPDAGGDVVSAAFTPGGDLLATSTLGGAVTLWDAATLRDKTLTRADLPLNRQQVLSLDWSPDGYLLLLFDAQGAIEVWGIPAAPVTPTAVP